jgi:hypothetical protein
MSTAEWIAMLVLLATTWWLTAPTKTPKKGEAVAA